jgi:predicted RNA-binding Zn ribbon-like protein
MLVRMIISASSPIPLAAAPQDDTCLAYANTRMYRGAAEPMDDLRTPADLPAKLPGLPDGARATLTAWASAHPEAATALFTAAVALRELIFRLFAAMACGAPAAEADLAALNAALAAAPPRVRLARLGAAYIWQADATPTAPALLAPVLWSAADLLVEAPRRRIRICANPECGWLFIDASKNGTRRWCDMSACGNRAKAQRHYAKTRATGA